MKTCASCQRGGSKIKITQVIDVDDNTRVDLCHDCNLDWFRREKAFARARGEVWDAGKAGAPK